MSSRANASKYGGGVRQHSGQSLMQILAAAKGHNEVQGGPQIMTMPDGTQKWTYNPATAKKGFLSRWGTGRGEAEAMNANIGGQAYLQQERGTQDMRLVEFKAKLEKEIGKEAADRAIELMRETAKEARETNQKQQQNEVLGKAGIVNRGKEDVETYGRGMNDEILRNMLARTQADTGVVTSPEYAAGGRAKAISPLFENFRAGSVNTAPGNVTTLPPTNFNDLGNLNRSPQIMGQGQIQDFIQGPPKQTDIGGQIFTQPGDQRVTSRSTPSYNRIPASSALIDQAAAIQAPSLSLTQPQTNGASQLTPDMLQRIMELYKLMPR